MSNLIRLAAGQVSVFTLLNTDSYLVTNFPRQSDMPSSVSWSASQPNKMLMQEERASLGIGGANFYGGYFGELALFIQTPLMRSYIFETIMGGKPRARVTVYMATTLSGFQALTGELVAPFALNAESDFETAGYEITHSNVFTFTRGRVVIDPTPLLLLGNGTDFLLLGNGTDKLALGEG